MQKRPKTLSSADARIGAFRYIARFANGGP